MQASLFEIRKSAGFITQEQLAETLGIERAAIAKWETGRAYPRAPMLPRLAEILGVSEGDIIAAITTARDSA